MDEWGTRIGNRAPKNSGKMELSQKRGKKIDKSVEGRTSGQKREDERGRDKEVEKDGRKRVE